MKDTHTIQRAKHTPASRLNAAAGTRLTLPSADRGLPESLIEPDCSKSAAGIWWLMRMAETRHAALYAHTSDCLSTVVPTIKGVHLKLCVANKTANEPDTRRRMA